MNKNGAFQFSGCLWVALVQDFFSAFPLAADAVDEIDKLHGGIAAQQGFDNAEQIPTGDADEFDVGILNLFGKVGGHEPKKWGLFDGGEFIPSSDSTSEVFGRDAERQLVAPLFAHLAHAIMRDGWPLDGILGHAVAARPLDVGGKVVRHPHP